MINGSLINSYCICKRKAWLILHRIGLEFNSDDVLIGKELHEEYYAKNKEILIDNIKMDQVTNKYIIELKKNDTFLEAAINQLKYYMYILNAKGMKKDGKIKILETGQEIKIEFNDDIKKEIENLLNEINVFSTNINPPPYKNMSYCEKCAYYEYCSL